MRNRPRVRTNALLSLLRYSIDQSRLYGPKTLEDCALATNGEKFHCWEPLKRYLNFMNPLKGTWYLLFDNQKVVCIDSYRPKSTFWPKLWLSNANLLTQTLFYSPSKSSKERSLTAKELFYAQKVVRLLIIEGKHVIVASDWTASRKVTIAGASPSNPFAIVRIGIFRSKTFHRFQASAPWRTGCFVILW